MADDQLDLGSLREETQFAIALVQEAEQIFLRYFGKSQAEWKSDNTPVTQADHEINDLMIRRIAERYPEDSVYGEESSTKHTSQRMWTVDPVDGTQAYDNGIPVCTIVISWNEAGVVQSAVISDPLGSALFVAEKGRGAFKNGRRIHCNTSDDVRQHYFATSSRMPDTFATSGQIHDRIEGAGGKDYNFRSFAYCGAKVAEGVFSGCVLGLGRPFDTSAPALLVEEAGGKASDLSGNTLDFVSGSNGIVLTNNAVHGHILEFVQK